MNIVINEACFGPGHGLLKPGTLIDLPDSQAYDLLVAGRATPADDAAVTRVGELRRAAFRRAGMSSVNDPRHAAHAERVGRGAA